ncbi:DUF2157 domain-containing protein [Massilia sp. Dwa41.01b]|nr:DUF2157 domain-containing protein [Massilia sp. Dwa41.01b]
MKTRLAVLELAAQQRLGPDAFASLWRLAAFDAQPGGLAGRLRRALLLLGALMIGLGLVFFVAANWQSFGRTGQFGLLEGAAVCACAGAALWRPARVPLALLALLAIGALFAFFGQTYQTGADAWQLFATRAALALPLAFGARSDSVWSAWTLVAMTALGLWGGRLDLFGFEPALFLMACAALLACALAALLTVFGPRAGAGSASMRLATLSAALLVGAVGVTDLVGRTPGGYYLAALLLFAAAAWLTHKGRWFDLVSLCIAALGLNVLIDGGLMRALLSGSGSQGSGVLLLLGLVAAGLLALTVWLILPLARQHGTEDQA